MKTRCNENHSIYTYIKAYIEFSVCRIVIKLSSGACKLKYPDLAYACGLVMARTAHFISNAVALTVCAWS